jgi:hypothetical protein
LIGERGITSIETLITADEAGLVIFWLKDKSLEESDNLPDL